MSADGAVDDGWAAQLSLRFAARPQRTELVGRAHVGPLRVQRPFYPEPTGTAHVYVLHPPGGVVGGDRLHVAVELERGARALLTTPAATKLYRSAGPRARIEQSLHVAPEACLEWLPQETIAFSAAEAELHTRVDLAAGARFLGWEIVCLGRPASGASFERGQVTQRIELRQASQLRYRERANYRGGSAVLHAAWGLRAQPVVGTLLAAGRDLGMLLPELRAACESVAPPALAAVSCMGELTVVRYLGPSTEEARGCFVRAWQVLRPALAGAPACEPRIWAT